MLERAKSVAPDTGVDLVTGEGPGPGAGGRLFAAFTGDVLTAGPEAQLAPTHYQEWVQMAH
jgi:hypothetical protein